MVFWFFRSLSIHESRLQQVQRDFTVFRRSEKHTFYDKFHKRDGKNKRNVISKQIANLENSNFRQYYFEK